MEEVLRSPSRLLKYCPQGSPYDSGKLHVSKTKQIQVLWRVPERSERPERALEVPANLDLQSCITQTSQCHFQPAGC